MSVQYMHVAYLIYDRTVYCMCVCVYNLIHLQCMCDC